MLEEYGWVYGQTEGRLRKTVTPFFQYVELQTLFLCLRHQSVEQYDRVNALLQQSLLSDGLRKRLLAPADMDSLISQVIAVLVELSDDFSGLGPIYQQKGLAGFEAAANRLFLEYAVASKLSPAVHGFFRQVIDHRNLLLLAKKVRWQVSEPADFVPGGTIPPAKIERARTQGGLAAVIELFGLDMGGEGAGTSPELLDRLFWARHTKKMRLEGRGQEPVGQVMSYLWQRYVVARHHSLLWHGRTMPRQKLLQEMIQ